VTVSLHPSLLSRNWLYLREMNERKRGSWVGKGAVAMATLAALSLAVTVWLAARALDHAADVVVLGDGEALIGDVVVDLWNTRTPLTSETLAGILGTHDAEGLRYVALADRQDHHALAEAGTANLARPLYLPGKVVRRGGRVRLVALIPPRAETRASNDLASGPPDLQAYPRPYLVIEFESPLIDRFHTDLARISVVAAMAAFVLVAFAFAWSRTSARLAVERERTEREQRFVTLGGASSVIAHEIRNPLAALKGHAQLLVEDLTEPARSKALRVVEGAERIEQLTTVLLDFVRDVPLHAQPMTTASLVERAVGPNMKERVRIDLALAPETLRVDERIVLALRNVIANAYQVTPTGAKDAVVRITTDAHEVIIEVRDHGPGIPYGAGETIFDPFMTTKTKGTGLGLSIARRIVEQHHGTLTGATHPEGGALFRLVLPR
jgi:two-component system, NtrC family, sensor histidine kinase HydH